MTTPTILSSPASIALLLAFLLSPFGSTSAHGDSIKLLGTLRDFRSDHPDFQRCTTFNEPECADGGDQPTTGIVEDTLGKRRKPVLSSDDVPGVDGPETFDQWFRNVPGVNESIPFALELSSSPLDGFTFYPIDGELLGNEGFYDDSGTERNFHFTFESHGKFRYEGGESLWARADDDFWLYLDGQLAIDMGGLHSPTTATIFLDQLDLSAGKVYSYDLFYAERNATNASLQIETDMNFITAVPGNAANGINSYAVPEPSGIGLFASGLLMLGMVRRSR